MEQEDVPSSRKDDSGDDSHKSAGRLMLWQPYVRLDDAILLFKHVQNTTRRRCMSSAARANSKDKYSVHIHTHVKVLTRMK